MGDSSTFLTGFAFFAISAGIWFSIYFTRVPDYQKDAWLITANSVRGATISLTVGWYFLKTVLGWTKLFILLNFAQILTEFMFGIILMHSSSGESVTII